MAASSRQPLLQGEAPEWVLPLSAPQAPGIDPGETAGGSLLLLVDRQVHAEREEVFFHLASRVLSEVGLQGVSRVAIEFDPAYQSVILHRIDVVRGGLRQSRLDLGRFTIVAVERDRERFLYNGTMEALLHLEDVRVGDTVEYAYTLRGDHPVYRGACWARVALAYPLPVGLLYQRLLVSERRSVTLKAHAGAPEPALSRRDDLREWTWSLPDQHGRAPEDCVPSWSDVFAYAQLTEQSSWSEVAAWALGLFPQQPQTDPLLEARAEAIQGAAASAGQRIAAALRFVQNEVRYLAFPEGASPHRAKPPGEVLRQRYGDCKDKSWLLCCLLRRMGIDAVPALVNSRLGRRLAGLAPTIHAFDHCIVQVTLEGTKRWYDPTLLRQGGRHDSVFLPDYGAALEVAKGVTGLSEVPPSPPGSSSTVESFTVRPGVSTALLCVQTEYRGAAADSYRHLLAVQGTAAVGRQFQDYYTQHFGALEAQQPVAVSDELENNVLALRESYRLEDPWKPDESNADRRHLHISAHPVLEALPRPVVQRRSLPFALGPPAEILYRAEIHGAPATRVEDEQIAFDTANLRFEKRILHRDDVASFECRLRRQADHVTAADLPAYLRFVERVVEHSGLTYSRSLTSPATQAAGRSFPWWVALALPALLTVLVKQCQ